MKKVMFLATLFLSLFFISCEKEKGDGNIPESMPRTAVPAELRGAWMYGQFSLTEYWSKSPSTYLGNGFTMAMAFRFFENGTYEQYFTSSVFNGGLPTYHQSVTKGTVEIDPVNQTIKAHPYSAHYKRTSLGITEEERDLEQSELSQGNYTYTTGVEPSGSKAIYLKLQSTSNPLPFISLQ